MPPSPDHSHDLKWVTKVGIGAVLVTAVLVRCVELVQALRLSHEGPLLAFPLTVIFPALLVTAMTFASPAASREGALMRFGTIIQCVLIVALPGWALHLALGLPVVFLLVELFETRCPPELRSAVAGRIVT